VQLIGRHVLIKVKNSQLPLMPKYIYSTKTERTLVYFNIEKEIFDEIYKREITLFGIFKVKKEFTLHNDLTNTGNGQIAIQGFKKK
jgi:hypothetical protein